MVKTNNPILAEFPERILNGISDERRRELERVTAPADFLKKLQELASSSQPIWAFGFPRSGSSWFGKYFISEFFDNVYKEPFKLFQASGQQESEEKLNIGTSKEADRPVIQQKLGLTEIPLGRLILAVHDEFWFYHHLDSIIAPHLVELFPESQFMFWCRDLRDMVDSFSDPVVDHWPHTSFPFLGEELDERFLNAVIRVISWSKQHLAAIKKFKRHIYWSRYENFTANFVENGEELLDWFNLDYKQETLKRQEEKFDARHGMWEDWEPWQVGIFYHTEANQFNNLLGYGKGEPDAEYVWQRPFPEDKIPPKDEIQGLVNEIQQAARKKD